MVDTSKLRGDRALQTYEYIRKGCEKLSEKVAGTFEVVEAHSTADSFSLGSIHFAVEYKLDGEVVATEQNFYANLESNSKEEPDGILSIPVFFVQGHGWDPHVPSVRALNIEQQSILRAAIWILCYFKYKKHIEI